MGGGKKYVLVGVVDAKLWVVKTGCNKAQVSSALVHDVILLSFVHQHQQNVHVAEQGQLHGLLQQSLLPLVVRQLS